MSCRVAVVGAGPLGLMVLKNLKEDGFDVTGYDARDYIGGLWNYSEDESLSVQESTIFNTSRYRSAISDFPFADDVDDFPTWQQMHKYLDDYCNHFDLKPHIKLGTKVVGLRREGGKWGLEVAPQGVESRTDWYDKVVVSLGSFVKPKKPQLDGIELFAGTAVHAIDYNQPKEYKDKRVLLVGLHATSQDVALSLSKHASKAYLSHKNGIVMLSRYTADHKTLDQGQNLNFFFFQVFMLSWFPHFFNWVLDKIVSSMSKKAFPNVSEKWNFSPAPSVSVTSPLIGDEIYSLMQNGFAEPCAQVKRITGSKTIKLIDGTVLTNIDSIIFCTGYDMAVPFLPAEFNPYPVIGEPPVLYRNIFPINKDPTIRNSLAILGQAAIAFPGFVQHEMTGMAVSQVWLGRTKLPSYEEMQEWRRSFLAWREDVRSRQKFKSTFYVAFQPTSDYIQWLDKAAGTGIFEHFGWSWKAWKFWWNDKELYKKCKTGVFSPAMWRLFETGGRKAWPGAGKQIFEDDIRAQRQIKERGEMMERKGEKTT